jgi:hypothetical protein
MKTLQEKIAELPLDRQQAIQKRFEKLRQMFLESKLYYPNTTEDLESENNI